MTSIPALIAQELNVRVAQVEAAVALLDDKATVPFIARYRKEATGGLDDTQLRTLDERLTYLRELEDRRAAILKSIEEQGKLTPELTRSIHEAVTKARLEDLYLPYKVKRRTKAQIAREAGLEPLATGLLQDPSQDPAGGRSRLRGCGEGRARRGRRARRRALDPDGDVCRRRRAHRPFPRDGVGTRRVEVRGGTRQGSRGREVLRLLQRHRAGEDGAVAPRARAAARSQGRRTAPVGGVARRRRGRAQ